MVVAPPAPPVARVVAHVWETVLSSPAPPCAAPTALAPPVAAAPPEPPAPVAAVVRVATVRVAVAVVLARADVLELDEGTEDSKSGVPPQAMKATAASRTVLDRRVQSMGTVA